MADHTDSDALIAIAQHATEAEVLTRGELISFPTAPHIVDLERYADIPWRKRGVAKLTDAASLVAYVLKHSDNEHTELYASWDQGRIVAVINTHAGTDAGWGDHRADLLLRATPAWCRWSNRDRFSWTQTEFAEHIEEGLADIVEPAAATMLEIAQTFAAHTSVAFKSGKRLQSGETQLRYEESTDAKAGAQGDITIPATFTLALAPWEGCPLYKLTARLRYRINGGDLRLSYVLDRPDDVQRAAFDDITAMVAEQTGYTPFAGEAAPRLTGN